MTAREILHRLPSLNALVVGDLCLDRWCTYSPALSEASRETGIPRVAVVRTEVTPGAAGTVANNLADLGVGSVSLLGLVGDDGFGYELKHALSRRRVSFELLLTHAGYPTFTYTKLLNEVTGVEDLPRVDFVSVEPIPEPAERQVIDQLQAWAGRFDVIFICDQAETEIGGLITPAVREAIAQLADRQFFFVDSRAHLAGFRQVPLKPNQEEAETLCQRLFGHPRAFGQLRELTQAPWLMVTHGGDGVMLVRPDGETWIPTERVAKPVDICGAGDSFSAGTAMAMAAGASPEAAIHFGHRVASITVMKRGTGTATPEEILA
ncbi:MAG: ribokinase [Bryobacteraceae bacterium]|nr:ribokinase [Bryobacteraceae bacterium]